MKFLLNNKIILCRNQKICEIYKIDENFRLLNSWIHNGEEIIAMNIYIEGTKDNDIFLDDSNTNLSFKKYNENESQTIEVKSKKGNHFKNKNKFNHLDNIYLSQKNNNNPKRTPFEKENFTNSSLRALNLKDNKKLIQKSLKLKDDVIIENKYFEYNFNSEIENRMNRFENEDDPVKIYSKFKSPSIKEITSIGEYRKNKLNKLIDDKRTFQLSNNELVKRNGSYDNYIQDKNKPTERSFYQYEKKIFILTVDLNGNFNLYHNNENKTIFNLYDISNIDDKYKEDQFFSMGFPYYVIMNSKYYAISTDHGIFVISNKV